MSEFGVESPRLFKTRSKSGSVLVWLDSGLEEPLKPDVDRTLKNLRNILQNVYTFSGTNACVQYLQTVVNEHIFMIVSGTLGEAIVPQIHEKSQLIAIYVFCLNKQKHEEWSRRWSKIRGVYTHVSPIFHELEQIVPDRDIESIPISFLSKNSEVSIETLDTFNQSFLYTTLLKEALLQCKLGKKTLKEFTAYCREQYKDNKWEQKQIKEFEEKYRQNTPIWWYTNHCFLYPILSRSLRMMDIEVLVKMGFFIRDLDHQIKNLYEKQREQYNSTGPFVVYRGQGLSESDFRKLTETEGGLICFNSFLSTTMNYNVALIYARRAIADFNHIGIVFKMTIDSKASSVPFANIKDDSFYKGAEQEILFLMNTVCRIGNIKDIEPSSRRLWEVELTLVPENDSVLNAITELSQKYDPSKNKWHQVGEYLSKIGKYDKAEKLYRLLLNRASTDCEKSLICYMLGWIEEHLGKYSEALSFYERSVQIEENTVHPNHLNLAMSYDTIGLLYGRMGDNSRALSFQEKAIMIYRQHTPLKQIHVANCLANSGSYHNNMGNFDKANGCYREAIEIYEKTSCTDHHLVLIYTDMGEICDRTRNFTGALWCFHKVLEKYKDKIPPNHPDLARCYQNIARALRRLAEYRKALSYLEKALDIFRISLPSNDPTFINCYRDVALVYIAMEEYSKAICYYEMARDICEKISSSADSDFINLFRHIGDAYYRMKEYSKALESYHRGLQKCQLYLASNALLLASFHYGIAITYYQMGHYVQAKPYMERTVEIAERMLPSHDFILKIYKKTLESVKKMTPEPLAYGIIIAD